MTKQKQRVFICHSWEDETMVQRLETELKTAGTEVWVDLADICGGDNLPERISDGLEWCTILLLVWSAAAGKSRWVKLEWTNAISLEKTIIPCLVDDTKLPAILSNRAYLDFRDFDLALARLLRGLKNGKSTSVDTKKQTIIVQQKQSTKAPILAKAKPSKTFVVKSTSSTGSKQIKL